MTKKIFTLLLLTIACITTAFAQYDPLNAPNTFRSKDNPYYWKNKMPYEGYWQQDVHYKIQATLDENTLIIDGLENLTYWNNSPDTLYHVYFHLYQNAFQPGSYLDDLQKNNGIKPYYGYYEKNKLGTVIEAIDQEGKSVTGVIDNTVLKIVLNEPLLPNKSTEFNVKFKTFFDSGSTRRRMKVFMAYGYKHFDGVHWYPRIAVYDHKFGWNTDQHLSREFYGDFGTFDVELTFANNYVVDATGNMVNRDEVLPKELREKLDIKNFKDKPWGEKPSVIVPYDSTQKKTWIFHAENVHDFAFTADPTYRIGEVEWNGVKCISLVQEPHASKWLNAADYTAQIIKTYSENVGMYAYPKMIVADAKDGMEYPMLTLDNGSDPSYRGLLCHEVGHNWFFGMIGTNETYRAGMDEGFTQWLTALGLEKIDGDTMVQDTPKSAYVKRFRRPDLAWDSRVYNGYLYGATAGDESTLNTHSDGYNGALRHGGGYRNVYYKTATMLKNLEYVLGEELFNKAMQNYFEQWKIAHPYFEDFKASVIDYTKVDLNWFFDQWWETSKTIDYAVKSVRKGENEDEYIITFKRKGRMQMPIDFRVTSKDEVAYDFHIPNTWFIKKTDATVLPKWFGWDKVGITYEALVKIPGGIKNVTIDPSNRLADAYMPDNAKKTRVRYSFDSKIYNEPDWKNYELNSRPDIWYNSYDGLKVGLHLNGDYLNHHHIFDANVWLNTGFLQASYDSTVQENEFDKISFLINYKHNLDKLTKNAFFNLGAKSLDGLWGFNAGIEKTDNSGDNIFRVGFKSMYRQDSTDLVYLLNPGEWGVDKWNNIISAGYEHKYEYEKGNGNIQLDLRSSTIGSAYDFAQLSLTVLNSSRLDKFIFKTRTFAQVGSGSNIPKESALMLASANNEELMDNKFTRSEGILPGEWAGYGEVTDHFHHGGGLNLRGYAGYLAPYLNSNGEIILTYAGNTGAALNAELEFDEYFRTKSKFLGKYFRLNTYLFGDIGIINSNLPGEKITFADFRADAGAGVALTIKKWGPLETAKPLTIRFDMPFFLNQTPALDPDHFKFRWILGVSRAF